MQFETDDWQIKRQQMFKTVPAEGTWIEYLGRDYFVYPNTFWPYDDSKVLVSNCAIKPGESVLDLCTGSGVIAISSCYKGASRVLAVDLNADAVKSAKFNAHHHGFSTVMEVRQSDLFSAVGEERFDCITINPPFRNKSAPDMVARSQWDEGFSLHIRFFREVRRYLKPDGRIYFVQADFGDPGRVYELASSAGMTCEKLAQARFDTPGEASKTFYCLIMRAAKE